MKSEFLFELRPSRGEAIRATFAWEQRQAVLAAAGMDEASTVIRLFNVPTPDPDRYFIDPLRGKIGVEGSIANTLAAFLRSVGFRNNRCYHTLEANWSPELEKLLFAVVGVQYIITRTLVPESQITPNIALAAKRSAIRCVDSARSRLPDAVGEWKHYSSVVKWIDTNCGALLNRFRQLHEGDTATLTDGRTGQMERINEYSVRILIGNDSVIIPIDKVIV